MSLKELKRDVDRLNNLNQTVFKFRNTWLKTLKGNTNSHFPFLKELDEGTKKEINTLLLNYQKIMKELKYSQFTQEKISSLAHYLIELKLSTLNGDSNKPKMLVNKFVGDDFLKLKTTIDEVNQFQFNLNNLEQIYNQVNDLLIRGLPLEHSVAFMDYPHKNYFNALKNNSEKQKVLLKTLGQEFLSLTKKMKKSKKI